jgi:phosphatidylglycerophosphate synthase
MEDALPSEEALVDPEPRHMLRNGAMMTATIGRLALIPELMHSISESAGRTAMMVGAVVTADVLDGEIARRLGVDDNARRIADATVDRVTIWSAFAAAIHADPDVLAWYAPLAVRGAVIATGSNLSFWLKNKLVLGGHFHKLASLSTAALGISLVAEAETKALIPIAATTYAVNAISGADYFGAHREVLSGERAEKLERIKIKKLSGLRNLFSRHKEE